MDNSDKIAAYILCGGKSSRMGSEKGLIDFKGKPFIQWIIEAVMPLTDEIFLVTQNVDYLQFECPLIEDIYQGKGPVGGIHTAFSHSRNRRNLILSCDIPTINSAMLESLISKSDGSPDQLIFFSDEQNDYPLVGIYPSSYLASFESAVYSDQLKLLKLIATLPHHKLQVDANYKSLLQNINTLDELKNLTG